MALAFLAYLNFFAYMANFYVVVNGFVFFIRAALFLASAFSFLIFFWALFKGFLGFGPYFLTNFPFIPFLDFFFLSAVARDWV